MSGPRGGVIDWTDPEQVKNWMREYKERTGYNAKRREERRNKPAGNGKKKGRKETGFSDAAYSTENWHNELNWDIDMEKIRRNNEE